MRFGCRRLVEERFQRKNGYEADCDVIYGDTDSVMVNFRVKDIARAMELGQEAAAFVSKTFIKPIKLEFEKVRMCTDSQQAQNLLSYPPKPFDLSSSLCSGKCFGWTQGHEPLKTWRHTSQSNSVWTREGLQSR